MKINRIMRGNDNGVALVFVLWVLVILSVIAGQFCYSMRNEVRAARLIKDESQAYYIAKAGIYTGFRKLAGNQIEGDVKEENQDEYWKVNVDLPPQPFGNGSYKLKIGNESGKINLNYAGRELLKIFFLSFELEEDDVETIVDSILDWRDADGFHRLHGAENDYYQSLSEPYKCRDGLFRYTDELLLVKGITKELYNSGLKDFISVVVIPKISGDKKKVAARRGLLNINAVPVELLKILPGVTMESVDNIIRFRQTKDITNLQELIVLTGPQINDELKKNIDYHYNRFYTFDAEGWTQDRETRQRIQAMVKEDPMTPQRYKIVQWVDNVLEY